MLSASRGAMWAGCDRLRPLMKEHYEPRKSRSYFSTGSVRGESCVAREPWTSTEDPPLSSARSACQCMCEGDSMHGWERAIRRIRVNNSQRTLKAAPSQLPEPQNAQGMRALQRTLPQKLGKIIPKLNADLTLSNHLKKQEPKHQTVCR